MYIASINLVVTGHQGGFVRENGVFWCILVLFSFYSCRASVQLVLEILSSCEVRINLAAKSILVRSGIYGNKSVLVNLAVPHSQLKKKSNSVAFHYVREGSALDEWRATYIKTHLNIADLLTKNLPSGEKRTRFCKILLHYLNPSIEIERLSDKAAAAVVVRVLPGRWTEAVIGAVELWKPVEDQSV